METRNVIVNKNIYVVQKPVADELLKLGEQVVNLTTELNTLKTSTSSMRRAQKSYFSNRTTDKLKVAMQMENKVDKLLDEAEQVTITQSTLF